MSGYIELKQNALKKYFSKMNECQQEAVFSVNGSILILAGAGSGKTTVIVNRIANMIMFGNAYNSDYVPPLSAENLEFLENYETSDDIEKLKEIVAVSPVKPWNILAVTFTNKAAKELKARLGNMLGEDTASRVHAATFHSECVRILRSEIENLGYYRDFTIYDSDDALRVIKSCLSDLDISEKMFPPKMIMHEISSAKDKILSPFMYEKEANGDYKKSVIAKVFKEYQNRLESANALDFDDIISLTVELFQDFPEILEKYQNRYQYIMVDEYQDTNMAQFELIRLLAGHGNLCVVGDDDQSIYKFRGADIRNILGFENHFKDAKVIKLEQNYRSTQNILNTANSIIKNNYSRKAKALWCDSNEGDKTFVYIAPDEQGEASFIVSQILKNVRESGKFSDNAILYRMNAQSNIIERVLTANAVPYVVFGGLRFYDRKEIKDIVAYLSVINNPNDVLRLKRIINEPKRGIGDVTVSAIEEISRKERKSPLEVMKNASSYKSLSKKANALSSIAVFFETMKAKSTEIPLDELLDIVMSKSGYGRYLENMGEDGITRIENIKELKTSMIDYTERNSENASLSGFLEEISLYTDMDKFNDDDDKVILMTIHSAKGLEFDNVFIAGMEENIFPSIRSCEEPMEAVEEERRLAYVAVTRARKKLFITHATQRMLFGSVTNNMKSRFIKEIDPSLIESLNLLSKTTTYTRPPVPQKKTVEYTAPKIVKKTTQLVSKTTEVFFINDKVKHTLFGDGVVTKIDKIANDFLLEINFEKAGTKKLMSNCGKITKI